MSIRERIIEETTKMFVMYGIKSIRMDDIAANLGISKRTIYEIFNDKETLMTECIMHHGICLEKRKKEKLSKAKNIIEELLLLMDDWDTEMETNYKLMSNVRKFYPKIYEKVTNHQASKGYNALRKKINSGIKDGLLLPNINYDLAIAVFSYTIFGITAHQIQILPNNVSDIDAFKYVVTYFFRGVATGKGIKMIDDYIEKAEKKQKPNL